VKFESKRKGSQKLKSEDGGQRTEDGKAETLKSEIR
jgi:hypothetical protein